MRVFFSKWHALGNDFLIVEGRGLSLPWERYAPFLAHRNFGLGCDQLLVAEQSQKAQVKMRIYNSDGSEAEMCGNGIRAFAAFILREQGKGRTTLTVETKAGIYEVTGEGEWYRVAMGKPAFTFRAIGAHPHAFGRSPEEEARNLTLPHWPEAVRNAPTLGVSVGNPHLVIFLESLSSLPLEAWGRALEHDPAFPHRINVEFVEVLSPGKIRVRVWERGAGATWACGTGATAAAVASIALKKAESPVEVELKGGNLKVEWKPEGFAYLEGPVTFVAEGTISLEAYSAWEGIAHAV